MVRGLKSETTLTGTMGLGFRGLGHLPRNGARARLPTQSMGKVLGLRPQSLVPSVQVLSFSEPEPNQNCKPKRPIPTALRRNLSA